MSPRERQKGKGKCLSGGKARQTCWVHSGLRADSEFRPHTASILNTGSSVLTQIYSTDIQIWRGKEFYPPVRLWCSSNTSLTPLLDPSCSYGQIITSSAYDGSPTQICSCMGCFHKHKPTGPRSHPCEAITFQGVWSFSLGELMWPLMGVLTVLHLRWPLQLHPSALGTSFSHSTSTH